MNYQSRNCQFKKRVINTKDKRLYQRSKGTEILALLPLRNDELVILVE